VEGFAEHDEKVARLSPAVHLPHDDDLGTRFSTISAARNMVTWAGIGDIFNR
jgi:hypothetical protein